MKAGYYTRRDSNDPFYDHHCILYGEKYWAVPLHENLGIMQLFYLDKTTPVEGSVRSVFYVDSVEWVPCHEEFNNALDKLLEE